jgi:hypothetical protein
MEHNLQRKRRMMKNKKGWYWSLFVIIFSLVACSAAIPGPSERQLADMKGRWTDVTYSPSKGTLTITYEITEPVVYVGMGTLSAGQKTYGALQYFTLHPEIKYKELVITGQSPLIDKHGNEVQTVVILAIYSHETVEDLNMGNLDYSTILDAADKLWLHEAMQ